MMEGNHIQPGGSVPDSIFIAYFDAAATALRGMMLTTGCSVSDATRWRSQSPLSRRTELRQRLIVEQKKCLDRILQESNHTRQLQLTQERVLEALKQVSSSTGTDNTDACRDGIVDRMHRVDEIARQVFAWLLLQQQVSAIQLQTNSQERHKPKDSGFSQAGMSREEIMEFCGLCHAALRIPQVQQFIQHDASIFGLDHDNVVRLLLASDFQADDFGPRINKKDSSDDVESVAHRQRRMKCIQHIFLQAMGYDPSEAMSELDHLFDPATAATTSQRSNPSVDFRQDEGLQVIYDKMVQHMNAILEQPTTSSSHDTRNVDNHYISACQHTLDHSPHFSDHHEGGVTRVVAVRHSEQWLDANGRLVNASSDSNVPPSGPEMMEQHAERQQQQQLTMARQAAVLQQEILGELLSMPECERKETLVLAQRTSNEILRQAGQLSPGFDRIAFLRSLDAHTQRLLAMHRLWTTILQAHDGQVPTMRNST